MKTKIHVTKLLPLIGVFFALTTSKGLSQWIVEDPGAIAAIGVGNGILGKIAANTLATATATEAIQVTTDLMLEEDLKVNLYLGNPASGKPSGVATKAAVTSAQTLAKSEDKTFLQIMAQGGNAGTAIASATAGNSTVFGKQLYNQKSLIPSLNPMVLKELPTLMRQYSVIEEAANNYYMVTKMNATAISTIEKDLAQKASDLASATTDGERQTIQAAAAILEAELSVLMAKNQEAANNVTVLALSNQNNKEKQADLASLKEDSKKMMGSLEGVAAFGAKTW
jgi:hypothetical protein